MPQEGNNSFQNITGKDVGALHRKIIAMVLVPLLSYVILLIVGLGVFPSIFKSMLTSPWPVCMFNPDAKEEALQYKVKLR